MRVEKGWLSMNLFIEFYSGYAGPHHETGCRDGHGCPGGTSNDAGQSTKVLITGGWPEMKLVQDSHILYIYDDISFTCWCKKTNSWGKRERWATMSTRSQSCYPVQTKMSSTLRTGTCLCQSCSLCLTQVTNAWRFYALILVPMRLRIQAALPEVWNEQAVIYCTWCWTSGIPKKWEN